MSVISLDLGGTKLSGAVVDKNGYVLAHTSEPLNKRSGDQAAELIIDLVKQLFEKAKSENINIEGIGCCIPGIYYRQTGTVWAPNIPGWENYPLEDILRNVVPDSNLKIVIDNDRSCSVMGEIWQGGAKGCNDVIFIAVGTGIGAGIVSGGQLVRGRSDIAGAVGWLALDRPFRDDYIATGCFEYHASGDGLVRVAKEYLKKDTNYNGILRAIKPDELTAHVIFSFFEKGDQIASRVLSEAVQYWGMAVANLVSIFNPEKIVFGGGVFGPAARFINDIVEEAAKWSQPVSIGEVNVYATSLGNRAGLLGAAFHVLNQL